MTKNTSNNIITIPSKELKKKIIISIIAVFLMALGVNFNLNANIGYAPFDMLTLDLQEIFKIANFGDAALLAHFFFIVALLGLYFFNKVSIKGIILAFFSIFFLSRIVNLFSFIVEIDFPFHQYVTFTIAVVFLSISIYLMGLANLIIPPYDKFVVLISQIIKQPLGKIRMIFDGIILLTSLLISFTFDVYIPISFATVILTFGLGLIVLLIQKIVFIFKNI